MVERILSGTTTSDDVSAARASGAGEREELIVALVNALETPCTEAVLLGNVMKDIGYALVQARPVFAAGLSVDQALGFITKMTAESLSDLEQAGAMASAEYAKQTIVLEKLNGFIDACNAAGKTRGDQAYEEVRRANRIEYEKLDALKNEVESGIANSLDFLQSTYQGTAEAELFAKRLDHTAATARYIGELGSPSFYAFKRVPAPGEVR